MGNAMKKILKYEAKQLFRDKKTIFIIFILPLIIFPLINGLLSKAIESKVEKISEEKIEIIVHKHEFLEEVFQKLENDTSISAVFAENISNTDSLLSLYPAIVSEQFSDSLKLYDIVITYSSKKDKNSIQAGKVSRILRKLKNEITEERFREIGIEDYFDQSEPVINNISSKEDVKNSQSAGFLPVTLIIILLIGTFTISNYIILGEKDNNTLESLLSSGVERKSIIYGKMTMVIIAGMIMSLLSMVSFFFYGKFTGAVSLGISLSSENMILLGIIIFTLSILISSVSVFVSCRLKSSSTGQMAFLPLMLLFLVLALMGTFEGVEIRRGFLLLPVISSSGIIKAILLNKVSLVSVMITAFLNIVYSFITVKNSSDYLGSEDILDKSTDLDFVKKGFSKGAVFTIYALLVSLYMMIGGYLQGRDIVSGLIYSQILILGSFVIAMKYLSGTGFKELLYVKSFKSIYVPAALILGLTARFPISLLTDKLTYVFPVPKIFDQSDIFSTGLGDLNLINALLIIAVLPAVFEEFVFRGVFFKIMEKKYSKTGLAVMTGLMFGGMHLNVFSFFQTAALGIIIGALLIRSGSIFPAMIMHFTNNAVSVVVMKYMKDGIITGDEWFMTEGPFAYIMSAAAVLTLVLMVMVKPKPVSAS